jgi:hypothetical protein
MQSESRGNKFFNDLLSHANSDTAFRQAGDKTSVTLSVAEEQVFQNCASRSSQFSGEEEET